MKLLYIFLDETKSPGVINKVKDKIRFLNSSGIDTQGIFLNSRVKDRDNSKAERILYVPLKIKPLKTIFNRRYLRDFKWFFSIVNVRKMRYKCLTTEVEKMDFDLILMRYPLGNKSLLKFTKKYKDKIIFEHNSKEVIELGLKEQTPENKYILNQEAKYGDLVLRNVKAIVGVGQEVVNYELGRNQLDIRSEVIPNGIEIESKKVRIYENSEDNLIKILFLTGSPSPWVGIDIVLNSLSNYSERKKVKLYIVGPINSEYQELTVELGLADVVEFCGSKFGEDLDHYFNICAIAMGTIAMHRVGLKEHSSLKVCEYAARGLPFVLGYDDTNFYKSENFRPYFKKVETFNKIFNFEEVIEFAHQVTKDEHHSEKMNRISKQELSFEVKMKKLANFLESL